MSDTDNLVAHRLTEAEARRAMAERLVERLEAACRRKDALLRQVAEQPSLSVALTGMAAREIDRR